MLLTLMAAPFSSRKSLLRLSWPGIGLTITMAAPRASVSDVVSPPGFDTTRSAAGHQLVDLRR